MPRYAPLPRIELDPRTEAQLVQAAARRVYEASGATINDFTPGSPVMALLEGQAFAQSEFLQFANEFPEAVLFEWIGPFLGAQRRTGSASIVNIEFQIVPRDEQFVVFEGYQLATDANLTGGESIGFVTQERLTIPPGSDRGTVRAVSVFNSTQSNVPINTIVRSITSLDGVVGVTNPEPAYGGQDIEISSETKERFFSLIRRRNPVSQEDWQDYFTDALGVGTTVTILGRRSEKDVYRYEDDYLKTNPSVAFYILNPDGTPISESQRNALQNLIRWSLPLEFDGHIYPMEVNDVDISMSVTYDPAKPYAQDKVGFSRVLRDSLFSILTPDAVFPVEYDPSCSDVRSALSTTFPATFGSSNQFVDPDITGLRGYFTPQGLGMERFLDITPMTFETGPRVKQNDLLVASRSGQNLYYQALQDFEPEVNTKSYHVNKGNLRLSLIRSLNPGEYETGDVVLGSDNELHVVLSSFAYDGRATLEELIDNLFVSKSKTLVTWPQYDIKAIVNETYDPDIIPFQEADAEFAFSYPSTPVAVSRFKRPGTPVYVALKDFSVSSNTTILGTAQTEGLVSRRTARVEIMQGKKEYYKGTYIKTPNPYELLSGQVTKEVCYVDSSQGALELFAYVNSTFFLDLSGEFETPDFNKAITELIDNGTISLVDRVEYQDCQGKATFESKPFRYAARFKMGEYLRYREKGGFDADELQGCSRNADKCEEISETCKRLFAEQLPLPRYFFVRKDFTPHTTDIQELIEAELISEVEYAPTFETTYTTYLPANVEMYSFNITDSLYNSGSDALRRDFTDGDTVQVRDELDNIRAVFYWDLNRWRYLQEGIPTYRDIFRFAPGDIANFRAGSSIRSYIATDHVTPLTDLKIYFDLGIFENANATETVKWVDPYYLLEDVIFHDVNENNQKFFRVMSPVSPPAEREVWNNEEVENTPRIEEFYGNFLKIVQMADCSNQLLSRAVDSTGTVKLGHCQISLRNKATEYVSENYVWESTDYANVSPSLSTATSQVGYLDSVDYGDGTVAL